MPRHPSRHHTISRPHRQLTGSRRRPVTDPVRDLAVATEAPRLQTRRLPLAIGTLACTGAALSLPVPLQALSLGDIAVESALGQPLRAHVPVQLAPGEAAGPDCVISSRQENLAPGRLPGTKFHLGEAAAGRLDLRITTAQSLHEPMYDLQLRLRCPGTPMIVRQYVLMLDLPTRTAPASIASVGTTAPAVMPAPVHTLAPASTPPPVHTRTRPSAPLAAGSLYRVRSGDTLSTIAARIRDRQGLSIWQLAARIFADNPQAFIGASPDRIRLGAEIMLPAPVETAPPRHSVSAAEAMPPARPIPVAAPGPAAPKNPVAESVTVDLPVTQTPVTLHPTAPASTAAATVRPQATPVDSKRQKPATAVIAKHTVERSGGHEAPIWQAILLGTLIGAMASAVLLRERLHELLSSRLRSRSKPRPPQVSPLKTTIASPPLPIATRATGQARESTMVVEESSYEPPAGEVSDIAWIDPHTSSPRTADKQGASDTLKEVLDMLESDYEQELTASQIIERNRFTVNVDELDNRDDDETLIRTGTGATAWAKGRR